MSDADGNRLDELLRRVHALTGAGGREPAPTAGGEGTSPVAVAPPAEADLDRQPARADRGAASTDRPESDGEPAGQLRPGAPAIRRTGRPADPTAGAGPAPTPSRRADGPEFLPVEPTDLHRAGVNEGELEAIVLKFLLARGEASGRQISEQVRLPRTVVDEFLRGLKNQNLIGYRGMASLNDPVCVLSDVGRERGRRYNAICTYFGSATVRLDDYLDSVAKQSIQRQRPGRADLERAFADLLIGDRMMRRLGPAVNSGRGMFLFGAPGNGKTSIAERVTAAFGPTIWVPRAINVEGQIMRVFDPAAHEEAPLPTGDGLLSNVSIDQRWVRIRRPTIIVGGELTMDNLEVSTTLGTGICEAPLQLKSNCGTLVIDDFGRQKMGVDQLLNRWIVPLEKRYDFLNMPGGKKIQVPFDQLIIFSTNLEPRDLCDDAFLRRIPYKIEVVDPTEDEFRRLFAIMCPKLGFRHDERVIDDLIARHYRPTNRPFRCCQPRDLLLQVANLCRFEDRPLELTTDALDAAVENYFAIM